MGAGGSARRAAAVGGSRDRNGLSVRTIQQTAAGQGMGERDIAHANRGRLSDAAARRYGVSQRRRVGGNVSTTRGGGGVVRQAPNPRRR